MQLWTHAHVVGVTRKENEAVIYLANLASCDPTAHASRALSDALDH